MRSEERGREHAAHHHADAEPLAHGHPADSEALIADFRRRFRVCLLLTVPIVVLSPLPQQLLGLREVLAFPGDLYLLFVLSSAVYFYGGWPFLTGFVTEVRTREIGMMTLISVAITVAYAYSSAVVFGLEGEVFYWELATLVDVMLAGHWIQARSLGRASRALEELARLMPSDAHLLAEDGSVRDVPLSELRSGARVLVKPGEKLPADGVVVSGATSVNEAMLTGESTPVAKREGDEVIGGSINGEGSVTVEVRATGADSFLSQVIEMVRQAQGSKSRTQDLADRAALWLTVIALGGGGLTFLVWSLLAAPVTFSLARTVTVMVIACPHALGLAIPLVVAVSTSLGAGNGLLIRNRRAFEAARDLQAVVLDKTGTLTEGRFALTDIVAFGLPEDEVLRLAAAVEAHSEHPIARGIAEEASARFGASGAEAVEGFRAIPGAGAEGRVDGRLVQVVSPAFLGEQGLDMPQPDAFEALSAKGRTVVFAVVDGQVAGALALGDRIRPESREAVARLRSMGVTPILLTGDNRVVAKAVADELGIGEYYAEVLPQDKAAKVREVQDSGRGAAMVGDGVNDAPALAQADVGIAIGAGTDVAAETADVILVRSDPRDVVAVLDLSRATYRKMLQNLAWATGYNVVAIPLAAGVLAAYGILLSPAVGAALMSASTVIVALNARLLRMPARARRRLRPPPAPVPPAARGRRTGRAA